MAILLLLQDTMVAEGTQPRVALGPDGTVHVVYLRAGNIEVASSSDGKNFESAVALDARGRATGGADRGPRIAAWKGGIVVTAPVCFDDLELKKRYPSPDLWLVRSSDGKSWTKPVRINEVPKKAGEALHWLAVSPDGDAHVAWLDSRELGTNCLWYAKVGGTKPGRNVRLTGPVCECCAPGMAVDAKGNPVIVVREGRTNDRGVILLRSREKPVRVSPLSGGVATCPMDAPAVAVSGKKIAVAWMDMRRGNGERDAFLRVLPGAESPLGETEGVQGHASLAFDEDRLIAAWESRGHVFVDGEQVAAGSCPSVCAKYLVYESNGRVFCHPLR